MVEFRSILQIRVAMPLAERVSCQSWVKRFTGPSMRQFLPVFPKLKSRAVPVLLNTPPPRHRKIAMLFAFWVAVIWLLNLVTICSFESSTWHGPAGLITTALFWAESADVRINAAAKTPNSFVMSLFLVLLAKNLYLARSIISPPGLSGNGSAVTIFVVTGP